VAQFQSEIELRVKVLDKELNELEKRIAKVANPFSASGARKGQSKAELTAQKQLLSVDRNRLQLAQQLNVERVKTTNLNTSWYKALQQGKQIQLDINKAVAKEAELRAKTAAASQKAARQRIGSGLASGAIGGAFPLLFGQGGAGAVGGALGGLGGGLIGGQFGFALSLVGSAIGDAIDKSDQLNKSIAGLNASFDTTTTTVSLTRDQISDLASDLSIAKDEAVELLGTFSAFTGLEAAELARGFSEVGGADTARAVAKARLGEKETLEAINSLRSVIGNQEAESLLKTLEIKGAQAASAALLDALLQKQKDITTETASQVTFWDQIKSAVGTIASLYGGIYGPANPIGDQPSAQEIADERAAGVQAADKSIIDTAIGNLERFYKESNRLEELYKPKRGGGRSGTNEEQRIQQRLAALQAETAAIQRRAEIESKISQARIAEDQSLVNRLTLERELSTIREREEKAAARVTDARLKQAIAERASAEAAAARSRFADKEAERIAKAERSYTKQFEALTLQLQSAQAITEEEKRQAELQLILLRLREANKDLTKEQLTELERLTTELFNTTNLTNFEKTIQGLVTTISGQLKNALETALVDTIAAAIQGADDLNEKLQATAASLLTSVGKALFSAGVGSIGSAGNPGTGLLGQIFKADGGPVAANRPYIVGEREPELFVPSSSGTIYNQDQMRDAMSTYSEGVKPSAMYEPMNINVETTTINGMEFITPEQFRKGVDDAAVRGAKMGEGRAMNRLRQSRSTRSKIGI